MNFNGGISSNKVGNGERFFLIRFKNELKSSLFTSMYVILKEEPPPSLFYIFVYIVYFLQLLYIPLHTNVRRKNYINNITLFVYFEILYELQFI